MPSCGTAGREVCRAAGVVVTLMSLAIPTPRVYAQDTTEASSLQKEVEELRREVKSLQEQVKTLKAEPTPAPPPQARPTPAPATPAKPAADSIVALRESWSHVERGMTQAQITGLLGAPTKELTIDGKLVWYYYYAGIGGASVFFNGDGHVSSKQRPTVGWW
jgi:hypothetical protein